MIRSCMTRTAIAITITAAIGFCVYLAVSNSASSRGTLNRDAESSHIYLKSRYTMERENRVNLSALKRSTQVYTRKVQRECRPLVEGRHAGESELSKQPTGKLRVARKQLLLEAITAVGVSMLKGQALQVRRFLGKTQRLRWSNSRVNRVVHLSAAIEALQLASGVPSLCADIRTWILSGYRRLARATARPYPWENIDARLESEIRALGYLPVHPNFAIIGALGRYLPTSGRSLAREVKTLEYGVGRAEFEIFSRSFSQLEHLVTNLTTP